MKIIHWIIFWIVGFSSNILLCITYLFVLGKAPLHINYAGTVDSWGDRRLLMIFPMYSSIVCILGYCWISKNYQRSWLREKKFQRRGYYFIILWMIFLFLIECSFCFKCRFKSQISDSVIYTVCLLIVIVILNLIANIYCIISEYSLMFQGSFASSTLYVAVMTAISVLLEYAILLTESIKGANCIAATAALICLFCCTFLWKKRYRKTVEFDFDNFPNDMISVI